MGITLSSRNILKNFFLNADKRIMERIFYMPTKPFADLDLSITIAFKEDLLEFFQDGNTWYIQLTDQGKYERDRIKEAKK